MMISNAELRERFMFAERAHPFHAHLLSYGQTAQLIGVKATHLADSFAGLNAEDFPDFGRKGGR